MEHCSQDPLNKYVNVLYLAQLSISNILVYPKISSDLSDISKESDPKTMIKANRRLFKTISIVKIYVKSFSFEKKHLFV